MRSKQLILTLLAGLIHALSIAQDRGSIVFNVKKPDDTAYVYLSLGRKFSEKPLNSIPGRDTVYLTQGEFHGLMVSCNLGKTEKQYNAALVRYRLSVPGIGSIVLADKRLGEFVLQRSGEIPDSLDLRLEIIEVLHLESGRTVDYPPVKNADYRVDFTHLPSTTVPSIEQAKTLAAEQGTGFNYIVGRARFLLIIVEDKAENNDAAPTSIDDGRPNPFQE
jgi:hypothetical protein